VARMDGGEPEWYKGGCGIEFGFSRPYQNI
jgi:hypothetical protein